MKKPSFQANYAITCWEFKRCKEKENCPAFPEAGTKCAFVVGTKCNGNKKGGIMQKFRDCDICEYFKIHIQKEFDH